MSLVPGHLTVAEAAIVLDKDESTVCRYVRKRYLPHKRLGRNILIPQKALDEFEPPQPGNPAFKAQNS